MRRLVLLILLLFAPSVAAAETVRAVAVVDGDTVMLDDGREVRLVGIQAPKLPLGRRNFPTWPLAAQAKAELERLVLGRRLMLRPGATPMDRHGRVLAHLSSAEGEEVWVQGAMLHAGLARVYTFADNRDRAGDLYAAERQARAALAGIWALDWYRIRPAADADALGRDTNTFQLVEGRVVATGRGGDRLFLNFGDDYRTDFTAALDASALRLFRAARLDPATLAGRNVRLRGWLRRENGPLIDISHPEQIEVLP
jgi:micrococcal nuclease